MTVFEFRTARETLRLTTVEAAEICGTTGQYIRNIENGGKLSKAIAQKMIDLLEWRSKAFHTAATQIAEIMAKTGNESSRISIVWYDNPEDFGDRNHWRAHQSICAELSVRYYKQVRLVPFERDRYLRWLADRDDTTTARFEWAALQ
ncbi:hypothetical protein FACS189487_04990 [Campylobacterota bacterium]|nr:hypothetical protein FACS189487_04990 [Campylobacterota bacterium]